MAQPQVGEIIDGYRFNGGDPGSQDSWSQGPSAGDVVDGYKFKGGDPNDEASWSIAKTESKGILSSIADAVGFKPVSYGEGNNFKRPEGVTDNSFTAGMPEGSEYIKRTGSVMDGVDSGAISSSSLQGRNFSDASKQSISTEKETDAAIERSKTGDMSASPLRNSAGDIANGLVSGLKTSLGKGAATAIRGTGNFFRTEAIGNPELQAAGKAVEQSGKSLYDKYSAEEARNQPEFETATGKAIYGGARSLENMLATLLLSGGNPTAALAGMTGQVAIGEAGNALAKGKDYFEAGAYGAGQGALEFVTEKLPMGFIADKLGKEGFKKFISGYLIREMPSEQVATLTQDALQKAVLEPDKTWAQYLKERPAAAYETAVATGVMVGGMGVVNQAMSLPDRLADMESRKVADAAKASAMGAWSNGLAGVPKAPTPIDVLASTDLNTAIATATASVSAPINTPTPAQAPIAPINPEIAALTQEAESNDQSKLLADVVASLNPTGTLTVSGKNAADAVRSLGEEIPFAKHADGSVLVSARFAEPVSLAIQQAQQLTKPLEQTFTPMPIPATVTSSIEPGSIRPQTIAGKSAETYTDEQLAEITQSVTTNIDTRKGAAIELQARSSENQSEQVLDMVPVVEQQKPAKTKKSGLQQRDDLVGAIMRVTGNKGIAANMAQDITGDTANRVSKLRGLFTNDGTADLGDTAMLLREQEGYDVRDAEHLSELIRDASDGNMTYSMERNERDAAANAEKEYKNHINERATELGLKKVGGKRTLAVVEADIARVEQERDDMEAREERAAIQAESAASEAFVADDAPMSEDDFRKYFAQSASVEYTQEDIDRAIEYQTNRENDRTEAATGYAAEGETQGDSGQRNKDGETQEGTRGTAEEGLTLTGETNAKKSPPKYGIYQLANGSFAKFDRVWYRGEKTERAAMLSEIVIPGNSSPKDRLNGQSWVFVKGFSRNEFDGSPLRLTKNGEDVAVSDESAPNLELTGETNEEASANASRKIDPNALTKEEINAQSAGFGLQQQEGAPNPGPVQEGLRFSRSAEPFKDSETRPFSDVAQFLEQHVYGKEVGASIPNPVFTVGKLSDKTVSEISALIDGFSDKHATVRVSGYSLKHSDEQRHDKFAAVVADYPKAISGEPEILWNPTRENSVFVVYQTDSNNLLVLEVAKNGNGTDIVNVITTKNRGMKQYRSKTATRLEGRLAPHPQVSEETPAGGDKFSAVQEVAAFNIQPTLENIKSEWAASGIKADLIEKDGVITVSRIVVPEDSRNQGVGTSAMQSLVDYADANGKHIALTPSADFGGNKNRLIDFYKRFGFIENKGRNRAFSVSESMVRESVTAPKPLYSKGESAATPLTESEATSAITSKLGNAAKVLIDSGWITFVNSEADLGDIVSFGGLVSGKAIGDVTHGSGSDVEHLSNVINSYPFKEQLSNIRGIIRDLRSSGVQTSSDESDLYSRPANAKALRNIASSKSFIEQGFSGLDTPSRAVMLESMLGLFEDNKVFDPVIVPDAVNVVNFLIDSKFSPEVFFHNSPVDKDVSPVNSSSNIPVFVNVSISRLMLSEAGIPAKDISRWVDSSGFSVNLSFANNTFNHRHKNQVTVNENSSLPYNSGVQGATLRDGRIVLVLNNLNASNIYSVALHEGFHSSIKQLLGEKTYQQLMDRLGQLSKLNKSWAAQAEKSIPTDTKPENWLEEIGAYSIEAYNRGEQLPGSIRKWVEDFLSAIRSAIISSKHMPERAKLMAMKALKPQDLSRLAIAGLKAKANGIENVKYDLESGRFEPDVDAGFIERARASGVQGGKTTLERAAISRTILVSGGIPEGWGEGFKPVRSDGSQGFPTVLYSRAAVNQSGFIYGSEAREKVAVINRSLLGKAKVVVVGRNDPLPQEIESAAADAGVTRDSFGGVIYENTAYIVEESIKSLEHLEQTIFHEIYGHYGIRSLFGKEMYSKLSELYLRIGSQTVLELAKKYGVNIDFYRKTIANQAATAPQERIDRAGGSPNFRQAIITEELLAHIAESETGTIQQKAKEVIGMLRQWLRSHGFASLAKYGETDLAYLLKMGRDAIVTGKTADGAMVAFSAAQPATPSATLPEETKAEAAQRKVQDKFNRFTAVKDWLKSHGLTLSPLADVYRAEERYHGRVATRIEDFREKTINPIIQKVQAAGFTMVDVADFLEAQHTAEANAHIQKITGDATATAAGITDADAAAYLARAKPELESLANEFRDITNKTRDLLLKNGIITQEMADAWEATYQHYVPLKGGQDEAAQRSSPGPGMSVNAKQKRRLGHGKRDEHVVENIMRDHERAIVATEKNLVGQYMLKMALEVSALDPDLITINQPEKRKVLMPGKASYVVEYNGSVIESFENRNDANRFVQTMGKSGMKVTKSVGDPHVQMMAAPMLQENEATVYLNGHAVRVQINDPILAQQYKNLGVEQLNAVLSAARGLNNWLSKAYTGYNPEFILVNMARDFTGGMINLTGNYGVGMASKALANYPKAFKEVLRYAITGNASADVQQYRDNGGSTGSAYLSDIERVGKDVEAAYNEYVGIAENTKQGNYWKATRAAGRQLILNGLLKWVNHLNAASENAMRVATFVAVRDKTGSVAEAASAAKNVTVNFNRKGESGSTIGALYLFANPNIQGTAALYKALFRGEYKSQAWTLVGGMMALAAMMAMQFDDDEWEKIPEYEKDRNLLIRVGDKRIKIPVPYGYGFFFGIGNVYKNISAGDSPMKVSTHLASSFFEHFSPLGNPIQSPITMLPTAIKIPMEPALNVNDFGRKIVPENQFNENKPDFLKMNRTTKGGAADAIARELNELSGGTKATAGRADVSPETLKYWWKTLTGGTGAFFTDVARFGGLTADGATPDLHEIPLIRKFASEGRVSDSRSVYYQKVDEAKKAWDAFHTAQKERDQDGMDKLKGEKELFALAKASDRSRSAVKALRDRQDAILQDESKTLAERRLEVKLLERKEEELYQRVLNSVK